MSDDGGRLDRIEEQLRTQGETLARMDGRVGRALEDGGRVMGELREELALQRRAREDDRQRITAAEGRITALERDRAEGEDDRRAGGQRRASWAAAVWGAVAGSVMAWAAQAAGAVWGWRIK